MSLSSAIGGSRLVVVLEQMLRHPDLYFRGMPDLLFWKICINKDAIKEIEIDNQLNRKCNEFNRSVGLNSPRDIDINLQPISDFLVCDRVTAVEVKSENDKLSKWQVLWIELLVKARIPVEVMKVNSVD